MKAWTELCPYSKLLIGLGAATLSALAACSKSDPYDRIAVSGSVIFQGQPVADGEIRFAPLPGTMVPVAIESITAGRYATKASGGVPVGSYTVEIRAYDPRTPPPKAPYDPPQKQLLPAKYNDQSTLELTVESGQTDLRHDFNLSP